MDAAGIYSSDVTVQDILSTLDGTGISSPLWTVQWTFITADGTGTFFRECHLRQPILFLQELVKTTSSSGLWRRFTVLSSVKDVKTGLKVCPISDC
ncbi:hypothetical protein AVEN_166002-1 [Araneus ventricosus]|uniref:Uncharacterized protein n=1 Tax=Araneus ventricosus TaxID=182803 RepID=A0A4Y2RHH8_ARAVE|nr:hypothetical protein AVEN_166002-1 [Araneus ventricosus]